MLPNAFKTPKIGIFRCEIGLKANGYMCEQLLK